MKSLGNQITITDLRSTPNPAPSGGVVTLSATVTQSLPGALTYAWSATCTGTAGAT